MIAGHARGKVVAGVKPLGERVRRLKGFGFVGVAVKSADLAIGLVDDRKADVAPWGFTPIHGDDGATRLNFPGQPVSSVVVRSKPDSAVRSKPE